MRRDALALALAAVTFSACTTSRAPATRLASAAPERVAADASSLSDAEAAIAWQKTRASANLGDETLYYWAGEIFADRAPAAAATGSRAPLFRFEGFNVARVVASGGRLVVVSREAAFYEDPATGSILRCWQSPWDAEGADGARARRVLHVWNDPVEFPLAAPPSSTHDGRIAFATTVLVAYPSPLAGRAEYAPYSAGDVYRSVESFTFFASRADVASAAPPSAPVDMAWTRVGPWLPWMRLPGSSLTLVYSARGHKLPRYEALPAHVRAFVEAEGKTRFAHAPTTVTGGPNATSWRTFKEELDAGRYAPDCP